MYKLDICYGQSIAASARMWRDLSSGVHACMHEPLVSESAVWWRGEGWVDPVIDIAVVMGLQCN